MRGLLIAAAASVLNVALMSAAHSQEMLPAAPTDLFAGPYGRGEVMLLWYDNADNEDAYRIERSASGENGPWTLVSQEPNECPLPNGPQCGYVDRTLAYETTYWYRVAAVNSAGVSAYSNVAAAETLPRPTPEPGTIMGLLFHDLDGDGVRDLGEHTLPRQRQVTLTREGKLVQTRPTSNGGYSFQGLAPGNYTVGSDLDDYWTQGCSEPEFSYDPFQRASCDNFTLPWDPTSPNPVSVTLDDGGAIVDFAAEPADVMVVVGDAILETDHAPRGTVITALVNEQECGTTTVEGGTYDDFAIHVLGAGERPGCALPGDLVQFTVGGVLAGDAMSWRPLFDPSRVIPSLNLELILPEFMDIAAMQNHGWYWFERSGDNLPADGTLVQAMIDGVVCGEARLEMLPGTGIAGFSQLLVPSSGIKEGCGGAGSTVSFQVNGLRATTQVPWELRLRRLHLVVHGDPDCNFDVDTLDAVLVLQGVAGLMGWSSCGDPDALPDRRVDVLDALLILQLDAGLIEQLPITSLPWPRPVPAVAPAG